MGPVRKHGMQVEQGHCRGRKDFPWELGLKQAKGLRLSNQKANARPVYIAYRLSPVAANLCKSIAAVKKQRILVFKHKVAAHIPACFVPFLDL